MQDHGDHSLFPVGTRVQVNRCVEDFNFFDGTETGTVIKNTGGYLGIIVKFDEPRHFDGYDQPEFNFHPKNLAVIEAVE